MTTGELRTKVLAPASAGAIQIAKCHSDPSVAAERVAAMQKEAVDELRKDLVKRHRSLQAKLQRERQKQFKQQEEHIIDQHTREMQRLRREYEPTLTALEGLKEGADEVIVQKVAQGPSAFVAGTSLEGTSGSGSGSGSGSSGHANKLQRIN